jgi:hypothetical protein
MIGFLHCQLQQVFEGDGIQDMNIERVKELITELEAEVGAKVAALNALKALLVQEKNASTPQSETLPLKLVQMGVAEESDSYVDLTVKIIEANSGKPMRVKHIVERIRAAKNNPTIDRRSVEATLYQHVRAKGENSRVVKMGRGIYGLRRFPRLQTSA